MSVSNKCIYEKQEGERCNAYRIKDKDYCFYHDPDSEDKRKEATSRGGKAIKRIDIGLPDISIEDSKSVVYLLADTIQRYRSGELDSHTAKTLGYLADNLRRAIETADDEYRVEKIKKLIKLDG